MLILATRLSAFEVLHNIFNMATNEFHTRIPQALGIHVRQITCGRVTINCVLFIYISDKQDSKSTW